MDDDAILNELDQTLDNEILEEAEKTKKDDKKSKESKKRSKSKSLTA